MKDLITLDERILGLQDDGFEKDLAGANRAIAHARSITPECIRSLFRSRIRFDRGELEYEWQWILRG